MKNTLLNWWEWLSGKKTTAGAMLLFVDGGLMALGFDISGLKELGMSLVGVGVVHKVAKK